MSDLRTAAQAAMALWDAPDSVPWFMHGSDAMNTLRAALAEQPEPEPVAWLHQHSETGRTRIVMHDQIVTMDATWFVVGPLYLRPPREPVQLSDDLIEQKWAASRAALQRHMCFARAVEDAVLKANGLEVKP